MFLKNLSSHFKDFRKKAHYPNIPTFAIVVAILEIVENKINEIFTAQRYIT